jgi:tyrosine-protein kinase Etk/Wzc
MAMTKDQNTARGERMELAEVWLLLQKHRWLIAASTGLILAAVVGATMISRMQFKARGSLYLGELQSAGAPQPQPTEQLDFLGGGSGDVGTEIEILKSENLIKRAILGSGLNVSIAPAGWSPPRYWRWRLAHRDVRLLDLGSSHLLAAGASVTDGAGAATPFTVRFLSAAEYEVWDRQQRLGAGTLGQPFQGGELKVTLLPGPEGPPAPGATYTMRVSPIGEIAEDAARSLNVYVPKATGPTEAVKIVTVEFVDPSPRAAALFVETLMRAYLDRRQAWKTEDAAVAESFVIGQAHSMKDALDDAERKLADYKKSSSVVALGEEAKGMIEQLGKYEEQRVAARLQVSAFGQIQGLLKKQDAPLEQYLVGETVDPVLAGLSTTLAQAQQELHRIEERFTPDAPAVHEQQAQVDVQLKMIKNYVFGRYERAQKQLDSLNQMIAQFEDKLKTVPRAELDLAQLTRNADVLGKMYSFLLERQQQAAVTKGSTISRNHILDTPLTPYHEDAPAAGIRIAAGGLLGLLFGVVFVVLRRMLSPTFQDEREVRRGLAELPIFAAVPAATPSGRSGAVGEGGDAADAQIGFVSSFANAPSSPFAEAFRYLRTNIYFAAGARDEKIVLITSPSPGDGKTLCTLSLAAAFAADDKQVLVIEGDMHRPSWHTLFQHTPQVGLSQVLAQQVSWKDVVRSVSTGCGAFDTITAGVVPPSPAELLSSPHFQRMLQEARAIYDFVLVDSPPFPLVSDALIMSMHVDRVLTVLRLQNTRRRAAEEHLRRLSAASARYGIVLNDADTPASDEPYGYGSQPNATVAREGLGSRRVNVARLRGAE